MALLGMLLFLVGALARLAAVLVGAGVAMLTAAAIESLSRGRGPRISLGYPRALWLGGLIFIGACYLGVGLAS
ncbi:MAG: hypothetical protein M3N47_13640 [Chloroflexota bacterium]|nr:hypothetical protein [Chloroflexota bacterium]